MIAEVEAGTVATIIVKDMSQFGRDYLKAGLYTDILFKGFRKRERIETFIAKMAWFTDAKCNSFYFLSY